MKKVLSLLLVCTMIFSLAAIGVVNAAGEGYTLVAGKVAQVENEDTGDMETVFTSDSYNEVACGSTIASTQVISFKLTTNTAASGGYIAIDYDENKVMPVRYNSTFSKVFDTFSNTNYMNFATAADGVTTTASTSATYPDTEKGAVVYTWTGKLTAGDTIAYLHFACKDGVTTADFDADTFKISVSTDFATTYKLNNGAASLDYQGTTYKLNDGTLSTSLTYPNSDKTAGGSEEPVDWKTTVGTDAPEGSEFNAGDIRFNKDPENPEKTVQKKVTVFAKNTTGAKLLSETYGVQIGKAFYPGVGDVEDGQYWAVILVDTDGTFLSETSYSYTAKVGSEEATAGTVTVQ